MSIGPRSPRPALEIGDLELVLALSETGSTVGAAPRLGLTQSAVSRALHAAEDRLGAALFTRGARGLAPTRAGERILSGAPLLLAQLVELEAAALGAEKPAELRVVCECYTAYRWLPSTLAELRRAGGELFVTLSVEHTADPVAALRRGDLDAALLTTSKAPPALRDEPLFHDEIVFLVSRRHPLARAQTLAVRDLLEHPLIVSTATPEAEARWFTRQVFSREQRPTYLRFPLTEAIVDAARAGLGIAVMSEWIASPYVADDELVLKRLRKKRLSRPWRFAFRPEAAEAARRLRAVLQATVPRLPSRAFQLAEGA